MVRAVRRPLKRGRVTSSTFFIMYGILKYIEDNNEGKYTCYNTRKFSLDETIKDTVSENSDLDINPVNDAGKFAEDDCSRQDTVLISEKDIKNIRRPWFKYFLDGSRHVYKVDDIAIGDKIYPVLAGQLVVGCCYREDRDSFKKAKIISKIVVALPKLFYTKRAKIEDFAKSYCEQMNEKLTKENRFFREHNIKVDKITFYETSVAETDLNKYRNSGIAKIQNEMTDEEQLMVRDLCREKKLGDTAWLIKDGSLQYNPNFSNMDLAQFNSMRSNYNRVVGVSKSFNPDLLKNFQGKKMAPIIAGLKPFERTKAYVYVSEHSYGQKFAIWYLRLRKETGIRETNFSDIIKCEAVIDGSGVMLSDDIDSICANLIQEAYPVCYGKDSRWANHLYPVYLTETFCKSNYLTDNVFLSLF